MKTILTLLLVRTFGHSTAVRVFGTADQPWFAAEDVCKSLGIENVPDALRDLPDPEKFEVRNYTPPDGEMTNRRPLLLLNEPGFYRLIFRSDKPVALHFQDWIFDSLIPELRSIGRYFQGSIDWQVLFQSARSERVQMKLLQAAGITRLLGDGYQNSGLPVQEPVESPVLFQTLIDLSERKLIGLDCMRGVIAKDPVSGGRCCWLYFHAKRVARIIACHAPHLAHCNPKVLLHSAKTWPEWLSGHHPMRFRGQVYSTWVFRSSDPESAIFRLSTQLAELEAAL